MAVATETNKSRYTSPHSTTTYPITFAVSRDASNNAQGIEVTVADDAGVETVLTVSTDYTISGLNVVLQTGAGSYLNGLSGSPVLLPTDYVLVITRKVPFTQGYDFQEGETFPANDFEDALDRITFQNQSQQEQIARALKFPVSDASSVASEMPTSAVRASRFLAFDTSGEPIASAGTGTPTTAAWAAVIEKDTIALGLTEAGFTAFIQTLIDDADAATARATLGLAETDTRTPASDMINGKYVGEVFPRYGNVSAPSAGFPARCLTNFAGQVALDVANYPDLVPYLRAQRAYYLEGQSGQAVQFSGTAAASVITLDNNTANNDLLAALAEDQLAFGSYTDWRTVDWDGVTYAITAVDAVARTITVTGTPTAGAGNAEFYLHRIAGSTTTARIHSLRGRSIMGAGTDETISGFLRRDRFQGHHHSVDGAVDGASGAAVRTLRTPGTGTDNTTSGGAVTDTANGTPRTGPDTHGPDIGANLYIHCGRYLP